MPRDDSSSLTVEERRVACLAFARFSSGKNTAVRGEKFITTIGWPINRNGRNRRRDNCDGNIFPDDDDEDRAVRNRSSWFRCEEKFSLCVFESNEVDGKWKSANQRNKCFNRHLLLVENKQQNERKTTPGDGEEKKEEKLKDDLWVWGKRENKTNIDQWSTNHFVVFDLIKMGF